jgi:hypothetical protein
MCMVCININLVNNIRLCLHIKQPDTQYIFWLIWTQCRSCRVTRIKHIVQVLIRVTFICCMNVMLELWWVRLMCMVFGIERLRSMNSPQNVSKLLPLYPWSFVFPPPQDGRGGALVIYCGWCQMSTVYSQHHSPPTHKLQMWQNTVISLTMSTLGG